jgi:hypothetical protein
MSLDAVQHLVTRAVRDEQFRLTLRGDAFDEVCDQYGLTAGERDDVRGMDPKDLDNIAAYVLTQRIQRREAEFALFLNVLFQHTDRTVFFRAYHQHTTVGQFSRLEEARRFVDYATAFVLRNRLPGHLIDVLRFSLHVLELAETPKVIPAGVAAGGTPVTASAHVSLRRPLSVASFQYDILKLAAEDPSYSQRPIPHATTLLVQRDWRQAKRCRVFDLDEHPLLNLLTTGGGTVLDLAGRLPQFDAATVFLLVESLHERQIVHLTPPVELAAYAAGS